MFPVISPAISNITENKTYSDYKLIERENQPSLCLHN